MKKKTISRKEIKTAVSCEHDGNGGRIFHLTLCAPSALFKLSDTLSANGAIPRFEKQIERESKQILIEYLRSGESWVQESIKLRK